MEGNASDSGQPVAILRAGPLDEQVLQMLAQPGLLRKRGVIEPCMTRTVTSFA